MEAFIFIATWSLAGALIGAIAAGIVGGWRGAMETFGDCRSLGWDWHDVRSAWVRPREWWQQPSYFANRVTYAVIMGLARVATLLFQDR